MYSCIIQISSEISFFTSLQYLTLYILRYQTSFKINLEISERESEFEKKKQEFWNCLLLQSKELIKTQLQKGNQLWSYRINVMHTYNYNSWWREKILKYCFRVLSNSKWRKCSKQMDFISSTTICNAMVFNRSGNNNKTETFHRLRKLLM